MTKTAYLLPLLLAVLPAAVSQEIGTTPGGIVAIVGSDAITRSELEQRIRRDVGLGPNMKNIKPRIARMILDLMVSDVLVLQEAAGTVGAPDPADKDDKKKIGEFSVRGKSSWEDAMERYIADAEVDRAIEYRMKSLASSGQRYATAQQFYNHMKKLTGRKEGDVRRDVRHELAVQKYLWDIVFRKIDNFVAPAESRYYYQTHLSEFTTPVEVSFRRIFLVFDRINFPVIRKLIEDGLEKNESFESLAKKYSQDYDDPSLRGEILTKSFAEILQYRDPIPRTLRTLKQGEVTLPPVASGNNVLYYKLESRLEGTPKSYEEAQPQIEEKIKTIRRDLAYKQFVRRLRERTVIVILLPAAGTPSGDAGSGDAAPEKPGERKPTK